MRRESLEADVAIVGAGVLGCAIAERLSRTKARVVVIDRQEDVAGETSKSNSGIAASGWPLTPGSLEAALVTASSPRWEDIADRLNVPYRRCGATMLARSEAEAEAIPGLVERAARNGVPVEELRGDRLAKVAPHANANAVAAVHAPDEGVIDSIRLTIAYAELAETNGARFVFNQPLVGAERGKRRITALHTPRHTIRSRFVVNAAGLGADQVSRLLRCEDFDITPRRGEWLLLDREFGRNVPGILQHVPTPETHGIMVIPTTHGSVMLGPTAVDIDDKTDRATSADVLAGVFSDCLTLMPTLRPEFIIKSFAGLRPHTDPTYRIGRSEDADNVIQVAGVRSTGVSASPAVADHVHTLLEEAGLNAPARRAAVQRLPRSPKLAHGDAASDLAELSLGRTVVCACEKVTALEIHEALRPPLPARSMNGVFRRTHATWGRCQGSACLSGVSFIASLYLDCGNEAWRLPVAGSASTLGVARTRVG